MPATTRSPTRGTPAPPSAPGPTGPTGVAPASVPLTFLAAAGAGFAVFGVALTITASDLVDTPTAPHALAAVHLCMLAFLTTAVLGAVHQFAPVVGRRPLRSVPVARLTAATMVATAVLLPAGFATGREALVATGALTGSLTALLVAWNLSSPLAAPHGGVPLAGLRLSVTFLVATVAFGAVYAVDRQTGWFPLFANRVLAHAHLGLLGWLGLTYVAVAEKLWPMFLLAHRPRARAGSWAVALIGTGVPLLTVGLLFGWRVPAGVGGALAATGLLSHLVSFVDVMRHRRRSLELLHVFLFASCTFMVLGVVLGALGGLGDLDPGTRSRLVSAEVASLSAWIGLAVTGHVHKIVPFISYSALRARGVSSGPSGRPLMFGDLFDGAVARVTAATAVCGFAATVVGILVGAHVVVAIAGVLLAVTALLVTTNLTYGPVRMIRAGTPSSTPLSRRTDPTTEAAP